MSTTLGIGFTKTVACSVLRPDPRLARRVLTGPTPRRTPFCGMQRSTAQPWVCPELAVARTSGGVTGKMISPQSISAATAATGMIGQEGNPSASPSASP
ncbi:MAG: L-lactate permease [Bilophila wadsworthia]